MRRRLSSDVFADSRHVVDAGCFVGADGGRVANRHFLFDSWEYLPSVVVNNTGSYRGKRPELPTAFFGVDGLSRANVAGREGSYLRVRKERKEDKALLDLLPRVNLYTGSRSHYKWILRLKDQHCRSVRF